MLGTCLEVVNYTMKEEPRTGQGESGNPYANFVIKSMFHVTIQVLLKFPLLRCFNLDNFKKKYLIKRV